MTNKILSIAICLSITLFTQTACSKDKKDTQAETHPLSTPLIINNQITNQHQQIAGTHLAIIPPDWLKPASTFTGFENRDLQTSIIIIELPQPYQEAQDSFSDENLKIETNLLIQERQPLTIQNFTGQLLHLQQELNNQTYDKWLLIFGDHNQTFMINASLPQGLPDKFESIKQALLTVAHQPQATDPQASIPFSIDPSPSFQLATTIAGTLGYTKDGQIPTTSPDKASFHVAASFITDQLEPLQYPQVAQNRFYQNANDGEALRIQQEKSIEINNLTGYEITGHASLDGQNPNRLIYQTILFDENQYYILLGSCQDDFEKNLNTFKQMTWTFTKK